MKTSRPLEMHAQGKKAVKYRELRERGILDKNGWPKKIDKEYDRFATLWDWKGHNPAVVDRKGVYVLRYEGQGTIELKAVHIIKQRQGEIVFENTKGTSMLLYITQTDPRNTGNYIRNISIVRQEHLSLFEQGHIFNPKWIKIIKDAQLLRFLNWMHGNNSTLVSWKDRTTVNHPTWFTDDGVPVEILVRLVNEVGADPWFTLPHTANDQYMRKFAQYVRDNLDPRLKAHVEYSNEHWNWGFKQFHYFAEASRKEWGKDVPVQYHAKRATEVALIWDKVFGDEADTRVVNVLGTHTANAWNIKELLFPKIWRKKERRTYTDPKKVFDAVGVTTYFGSATVSKQNLRRELLDHLAKSETNAAGWLHDKLLEKNYLQSIPHIARQWKDIKDTIDPFGLKLLAYEGGQHVHHYVHAKDATEAELASLTTFLSGFTRSKYMANLYEKLWQEWKKYGDGPFMQFGDVGAASKWGSYSAFAYLDDSNPRAEFLMEKQKTEKPWW